MNRRTTAGRFGRSTAALLEPGKRNRLRHALEPLENRMMLSAVTWTIDHAQSNIQADIPDQPFEIDDGMGTVYTGTLRIRNQSGSNDPPWNVGNSAQISGTLATEYTDASSIEFLLGQSNLAGVISGNYTPDPANWNGTDFGGSFDPGPGVFGGRLYPTINFILPITTTAGYFNFSDVEFDLGSAALPITAGSFPANTTDVGISSAVANVKGVSIFPVGQILPDAQETATDLLTTNQAASGTITAPDPVGQPNLRELTLPIVQDFSLEISPGTPPFMGSITGQLVATATVPSTVTGRHLFYNESKYDGNSPGIVPPTIGANNDDGDAIATDKSAYLPGGGTITPASMSAYDKGINGVMVDLTGPHGTLSLADFEFSMSEQGALVNNTPSTWVAAPAPTGFTVLSDIPAVGTDHIEFIWANGAIENRYLEVTVKGNDTAGGFNTNTGLAASDIFYFGNQIADDFLLTGATFLTSAADEIDARNNSGFLQPLTNIYDYNKDSLVSAVDQIAARNNAGFMFKIDITNPPAAPGEAASVEQTHGGAGSAVASALAARSPQQPSLSTVPGWLTRRVDAAADNGPTTRPSSNAAAASVMESLAKAGEADSLIDSVLDEVLDSLWKEI